MNFTVFADCVVRLLTELTLLQLKLLQFFSRIDVMLLINLNGYLTKVIISVNRIVDFTLTFTLQVLMIRI